MNKRKKIIILLILILILILFAGAMIYNQNHIKIGNTYFEVPEGYDAITSDDYINITDGNSSLCLVLSTDGNDLNKSISKYVNSKKENQNISVNITQFYVGDVSVYKSQIGNDTTTMYYWFINNDKVHIFYTWSGNQNTDSLVKNLINSKQNLPF